MTAGRYRIVRELGRGGMAEVFEALALGDAGFSRRVAIKRLTADAVADPAMRRAFLDEARAASHLHHANIVAVLDYGVVDNLPFQVLELVDGMSVAGGLRRAAGGGFPPEVAVAIALEVARALDYAHGAVDASGEPLSLVHRDVTPGNVLLANNGDVKLTDFGIAAGRHRTDVTQSGVAKGTLLFMAPEQLTRGNIDRRTDVFGLGCLLHAMIAGDSPLAGDHAIPDLVAGRPVALSGALPDDVAPIIAKATQPAQVERHASADEMARALARALSRRTDRDGRAVVRDFVATESAKPPPIRPLDALFEVELAGTSPDGVRDFVTRAIRPPRSGATRQRLSRRTALAIAAVAAVGVATAVAAGVLALARSGQAEQQAPQAAAAAATPDAAAPPSPAAVPAVDAAAAAVDAATAAAPVPPATTTPARRTARRRADAAPVQRDPDEASGGTGFVVIGGPNAHRGEIRVDGKRRGFAPKTLELAVGAHRLELVAPDGRRFSRQVALGARHTESAPLRWTPGN